MKTLLIATALVSILGFNTAMAGQAEIVHERQAKHGQSVETQRWHQQGKPTTAVQLNGKQVQRIEGRLARMQRDLSLSNAQVAKLRVMFTAGRGERRGLHQQMQHKIDGILTTAQKSKRGKMRKAHGGKGKRMGRKAHRGNQAAKHNHATQR